MRQQPGMTQLDAMLLLKKAGPYNESLLILAELRPEQHQLCILSSLGV